MLELHGVHAYYGDSHVLHGVSLRVAPGEVVALLGRNGAGKTTTVLTIMGYLSPKPGRVTYDGVPLDGLAPHAIARRGFGFVPQERGIFPSLTVEENLTVAARKAVTPPIRPSVVSPQGASGDLGAARRSPSRWTLPLAYELFPRLAERKSNLGFQLSGGEQQMLSIARALMLNPKVILLDEPSEGLAPLIVEEIVQVMRKLKGEGLAVLLVEQNLRVALDLADRHYVMSKGEVRYTGTSAELEHNEAVLREYLSV